MTEGQHKDIICKSCNNIVFADTEDIQKRLNGILADIQEGTHYQVNFYDILTLLDQCMECCKEPNYWGRE